MKKILVFLDFLPTFVLNVITLSKIDKSIFFSINKLKFLYCECKVWIHLDNQNADGTAYSALCDGQPFCISLRPTLAKEKLWTVFLHEVGHLKDSAILKDKYWKHRSPKMTKLREKTAWKYALQFSKEYNISLELEDAIKYLQSYDNAKSAFLMKEYKLDREVPFNK